MTTTALKQLPIGLQTFANLINRNCYYVDKTPLIIELVKNQAVFLSRPRRFGKSLTLDTIAELFSGNKTLFKGLYAENNWDWQTVYPVIRLGFTKGVMKSSEQLENNIKNQLIVNAKKYNIDLIDDDTELMFSTLISEIKKQANSKVVILIDEYDKPMLDNLNTDIIIEMRDTLRNLYSVIKELETDIQFAMLTGVSKFSKVNIFSGLNQLNDITLDKKYSALCGYTQQELEMVFAERLHDVDLAQLKHWYNGYNWGGESVYNPFDILLFLDKGKDFQPYWIETGNSTFLIDTLVKNKFDVFSLEEQIATNQTLAQFDVGNTDSLSLMFQTGYLTIDKVMLSSMRGKRYSLKYPNYEVQQSINNDLLSKYLNTTNVGRKQDDLFDYMENKEFAKLETLLNSLFASIPHDWYRNNTIARYEGYWASVFYAFFASTGFNIRCEDSTNVGQIDMTVEYENDVFIFEFKVIEKIDRETGEISSSLPIGTALQQIKDKNYSQKYIGSEKSIYLFGIEFSEKGRNVKGFEWERV